MENWIRSFLQHIGVKLQKVNSPEWYDNLIKPWWTPPKWIFSPVWTVLYAMIALAAFRIFLVLSGGRRLNIIRKLFIIQFLANVVWSTLFFELHQIQLAFFNLLVLWIVNGATIFLLRTEDHCSAFILLPYQIWITLALLLNGAILWLN
ncbi:TspO/MBR family protein [Candidatus Similichlamydia epinepheli]|uniref:TspO/MBR family protein n=1 Tax=Candidatus Similichlamydia epinepheli TaxID=1903953 RepID=UPI000D34B255|nr:TspO/MBR family protein [Candidatus Similichlamydia epinepheli]